MKDDNTYMERAEYDGSEWWEYRIPPSLQNNAKKITRLTDTNYELTVARLHGDWE